MHINASIQLLFVTAFLAIAHVAAHGVCYDPNYLGGRKNGDAIWRDLGRIKSAGFNYVRTYWTQDTANMGKLIVWQGLNGALGVPFPAADTDSHVAAAIDAANTAGPGKILYILVGNENFAYNKQVPQRLFDLIWYIKSRVPSYVKVGTSQRVTEFLDPNQGVNGMRDLINACDVVGVNIHPFFTPNTDWSRGLQVMKDQWNQMNRIDWKFPGLSNKLIISEIGWPSAGAISGSWGSPDAERAFFQGYLDWSAGLAADRKFYFQMYNQPQRTDGEWERNFGLVDQWGNNKVNLPIQQKCNMRIDWGLDYVGQDIGSASASGHDDCCRKCMNFGGCHAFTFTWFNGGTCWFKKWKAGVVGNGYATSGFI
jgi:glucan endo-1,3-beta-D-glucosidase